MQIGIKEIKVTDIGDIHIGQTQDAEAGTGCTVFISEKGMPAGLDVRGGGPASRESELLKPLAAASFIHAIVLAGGSAYGLGSDIGQVPELVERFTRAAKKSTTIPVLAKLTPNVATMSPAAEAALSGGADGIAAINTIKSIVGVSPYTFVSAPAVKGKSAVGGYSGNAVKPIALRFIAEIGQNSKLKGMHISGMGGIETWRDALEFILMGSGSIQITTAVMQYGYRIIDDLKEGLNYYLAQMGINSIKDIIGAGLDSVSDTTDVLERDTVLFPAFDLDKCNGCGRCVISCNDGGHQAIRFDNRKPKLDGSKCVGCHLCRLVCPEDAIVAGKKRVGVVK